MVKPRSLPLFYGLRDGEQIWKTLAVDVHRLVCSIHDIQLFNDHYQNIVLESHDGDIMACKVSVGMSLLLKYDFGALTGFVLESWIYVITLSVLLNKRIYKFNRVW